MARRYVVLALVVMIPASAGAAFAQAGRTTEAEPTTVGIVNYYMLHAQPGPNWKARTGNESKTASLELIEDLKSALGSAQVIFSGVVDDGSGGRVTAIIRTGDEPAMRRMLQETGSVADGRFEWRVQPWYSPLSTWPEAEGNTDGC